MRGRRRSRVVRMTGKNADIVQAVEQYRKMLVTPRDEWPIGAWESFSNTLEPLGLMVVTQKEWDRRSEIVAAYEADERPTPSPWPFELGAAVYADDSGIEMRVTTINYSSEKFMFECAYWHNGDIKTAWFSPARLTAAT